MRQTVLIASLGVLIVATATMAAQHAEPAKATTAAGAAEPAKPRASPPSADAHNHAPAAAAASRPPDGKIKPGANEGLSSALVRIQERIDNETGSATRPRPATARRVSGPASPAAGPTPVVRLKWKTSLTWPAELATPASPLAPAPLAPIELTWK